MNKQQLPAPQNQRLSFEQNLGHFSMQKNLFVRHQPQGPLSIPKRGTRNDALHDMVAPPKESLPSKNHQPVHSDNSSQDSLEKYNKYDFVPREHFSLKLKQSSSFPSNSPAQTSIASDPLEPRSQALTAAAAQAKNVDGDREPNLSSFESPPHVDDPLDDTSAAQVMLELAMAPVICNDSLEHVLSSPASGFAGFGRGARDGQDTFFDRDDHDDEDGRHSVHSFQGNISLNKTSQPFSSHGENNIVLGANNQLDFRRFVSGDRRFVKAAGGMFGVGSKRRAILPATSHVDHLASTDNNNNSKRKSSDLSQCLREAGVVGFTTPPAKAAVAPKRTKIDNPSGDKGSLFENDLDKENAEGAFELLGAACGQSGAKGPSGPRNQASVRNWTNALLKKRVMTARGKGVVTKVMGKGWLEVRLDSTLLIKVRPGNVSALEGGQSEVKDLLAFAKKTKATGVRKLMHLPPVHRSMVAATDTTASAASFASIGGGSCAPRFASGVKAACPPSRSARVSGNAVVSLCTKPAEPLKACSTPESVLDLGGFDDDVKGPQLSFGNVAITPNFPSLTHF